jgi:hypothetical protein
LHFSLHISGSLQRRVVQLSSNRIQQTHYFEPELLVALAVLFDSLYQSCAFASRKRGPRNASHLSHLANLRSQLGRALEVLADGGDHTQGGGEHFERLDGLIENAHDGENGFLSVYEHGWNAISVVDEEDEKREVNCGSASRSQRVLGATRVATAQLRNSA